MAGTIFILEAKVAPNQWDEITSIYPRLEMESRYDDKEEALIAKAKLKWILAGSWKKTYKKRPIRIRETVPPVTTHIPN